MKVIVSPPILSFFETIVGETTPATASASATGPSTAYVRPSRRGDDDDDDNGAAGSATAGDAEEERSSGSWVDVSGAVHALTADRSVKLTVR